MNKPDKLPETALKAAVEAHKVYNTITEKISERMNYIIHHCVEAVGGKVSWWDWPNDGDSDDRAPGDFIRSYSHITPDFLTITWEGSKGDKMVFIGRDGGEYELGWGEIPTRWLYEDFEEEYAKGLKLYQEKQQQKAEKDKERKKQKDQEKKALVASASSKLSPEERKAIGLKWKQ